MKAAEYRAALTEAEWQATVIEYAQLRGWKVAHFRPAQSTRGWRTAVSATGAGFPDLVMVRAGRIIFAELKSTRGRLSAAQGEWLAVLSELRDAVARQFAYTVPQRVYVFVWRPYDWAEVEDTLR